MGSEQSPKEAQNQCPRGTTTKVPGPVLGSGVPQFQHWGVGSFSKGSNLGNVPFLEEAKVVTRLL